jgi:hypothetical protein
VTVNDARCVIILVRWMGWRRDPYDVPVSDATAADALVDLVRAAAKTLHRDIDLQGVCAAFESHCEQLRGSSEAEEVCEAIHRHTGAGEVVFDSLPDVTAAFDRWRVADRYRQGVAE